MRNILTLLMLSSLSLSLMAQIGVKAGVNFTNMVFEEDATDIEDLARNGATNFAIGAEFILPLSNIIALQPELLYAKKGAESSYTVLGQTFKNTLSYNYLDIPFLIRLSLGNTEGEGIGIYVNGGVYGAYAFNGKSKTETPLGTTETDLTFDEIDDQKRVDYGIATGGGVTLGNFFLEVRYQHGINNLLDDDTNNNNDPKFNKLQHRGVGLNLGIIF